MTKKKIIFLHLLLRIMQKINDLDWFIIMALIHLWSVVSASFLIRLKGWG